MLCTVWRFEYFPNYSNYYPMKLLILFLQLFLQQTGGRQAGWDDYDHQTFLKIRSTFSVVSLLEDFKLSGSGKQKASIGCGSHFLALPTSVHCCFCCF